MMGQKLDFSDTTMPAYRMPVLTKGYAIVKYPQVKAAGDYTAGLPRDARTEVHVNTLSICGSRMEERTVKLAGGALPER